MGVDLHINELFFVKKQPIASAKGVNPGTILFVPNLFSPYQRTILPCDPFCCQN